jgi:hypothetical protein
MVQFDLQQSVSWQHYALSRSVGLQSDGLVKKRKRQQRLGWRITPVQDGEMVGSWLMAHWYLFSCVQHIMVITGLIGSQTIP